MGTKISKKKWIQHQRAGNKYDRGNPTGTKWLMFETWKLQSEITGLTGRENWYILKHFGELSAKYGDIE